MTIETIELQVIGENDLCCRACTISIRRGISRMPGVAKVAASHKTQRIELSLDSGKTRLAAVQEKLIAIGGWQTREIPVQPLAQGGIRR